MNIVVEHDLRYASLLAAANATTKVGTLTHSFYRYPARFGETFVREAVLNFSREGDGVLDPFCGGGTTLVEALALGRSAIGSDLSELAIFIARAKTTPLSPAQLTRVSRWVEATAASTRHLLSAHADSKDARLDGMPARYRNLIANARGHIARLPKGECQDFATCVLSKTAQWALDGKETLPKPSRFVQRLTDSFAEMKIGMTTYAEQIRRVGLSKAELLQRRRLHVSSAERLSPKSLGKGKPPVSLVVTSPPYLGVHVLYNRWQLQGRRELKAPFFIANRTDLGGASSYTIVSRSAKSSDRYFAAISSSFRSVASLIHDRAYVVQLVSFANAEVSLPLYLSALGAAGLELCDTYLRSAGELSWRAVPGRRWYARVGAVADSSASQEVLLVHRKGR